MNKQDNTMNAFPEIELLPPESAPANRPFIGIFNGAAEPLITAWKNGSDKVPAHYITVNILQSQSKESGETQPFILCESLAADSLLGWLPMLINPTVRGPRKVTFRPTLLDA